MSKEVFNVKILSSQNIPVVVLSENDLMTYILSNPTVNSKTMIVYKSSSNFEKLTHFFRVLAAVSFF